MATGTKKEKLIAENKKKEAMFPNFENGLEKDVTVFGQDLFDYLVTRRCRAYQNSQFSADVGEAVLVVLHDERGSFRTMFNQDFPRYVEPEDAFIKYFMNYARKIKEDRDISFLESLLRISAFLIELCKYCEERGHEDFLNRFPFYWWKMFLKYFGYAMKDSDKWSKLRKDCKNKVLQNDREEVDDSSQQASSRRGEDTRPQKDERVPKIIVPAFPTVDKETGAARSVPDQRRLVALNSILEMVRKQAKVNSILDNMFVKLYDVQRERSWTTSLITNCMVSAMARLYLTTACLEVLSSLIEMLKNDLSPGRVMVMQSEASGSQGNGTREDREGQDGELSREMEDLDIDRDVPNRGCRPKERGWRKK